MEANNTMPLAEPDALASRAASARAPAALLPYQAAWIDDPAPVKIWEKSRRIGASWCEAADCALLAARARGMDCWYVGYNHDMAREFIEDAAAWSRHFQLAASEIAEEVIRDDDKDILTYRIRFASGHKIVALSSRPSNLRGKQGRVVIDEAAFHERLSELLKAALALLMWGGQVHVMSTHNGDDNAFNELVGDVRAGKKPYSIHRTTLDDALASGLYDRIALRRGQAATDEAAAAFRAELLEAYGEAAEEELFCVPARSAGQYLSRALIESCMDSAIPVLRRGFPADFAQRGDLARRAEVEDWLQLEVAPLLGALPKNANGYIGVDFGRVGDLTAIVPLLEDQGLRRRAPFIIELRNCPFKQQEQVLYHLADRVPRLRGLALDARGLGMTLAEYAAERYSVHRVAQVMLTQAWYIEYMPKYKAAFEDRNVVLPRDADLLDDHRAIRVERGVPKIPEGYRGRGRDGGQRHGDAAIAGCLAWAAAYLLDSGPIEYRGAEPRRAAGLRAAW